MGLGLFGQFLPQVVCDQWNVHVLGGVQIHRPLQRHVCRRGRPQVGASNHAGDVLGGVVHHHRQVIRPMAVGTFQHEVPHRVTSH